MKRETLANALADVSVAAESNADALRLVQAAARDLPTRRTARAVLLAKLRRRRGGR